MVARRLTGEPLAWIVGRVLFCDSELRVHPGVYVPRRHTEALARRAAAHLPAGGVAVDVCTGCGAVATALSRRRPGARVLATDIDPVAVDCARANGVDAACGDLFAPLPAALASRVDVVTAVVPYVPTAEMPFLQRDTFTFESPLAYDGGADGTAVQRRVIAGAPRLLRRGGHLLLEVGGGQAALLRDDLSAAGFSATTVFVDEEGDPRGVDSALT